MKKFLRFLLVLLFLLLAAVLIVGILTPKNITITRSILIKAPKDVVFDQVVKFKNWPHWSPWYRMDTSMKLTYSGTDGQPGSAYHWLGEEHKTGEGEMKNTAVNGTAMDFEFHVLKPWDMLANGTIAATDTAGMTKVTWIFKKHTPFPQNAMTIFIDMDKIIGKDFDSGLHNMKQYVEASNTNSTGNVEVKEVDYPAHVFEGMRQTVSMSDITKFCGNAYSTITKDPGASKVSGPAMGIYYTWDTAAKTTDMFAGFPVSDTTMPVKGALFVHTAPARAAMAVLKGGYGGEMNCHNAIMSYMHSHNETRTYVVEEYLVGPSSEPDSNKWVTNIYYMIK